MSDRKIHWPGPISTHALQRTSPKGQTFLGTCMKCGRKELTLAAAQAICDNPSGISAEEVIVRMLEGPALSSDGGER